MYQIVPGAPGDHPIPGGAGGSPLKKKHYYESRPLVLAGMLGCLLVLAAVVSWCYYSASLRKAQLLKTELLDLKKDGFIIHNHAGAIIFSMAFKWVHNICIRDLVETRLLWFVISLFGSQLY